MNRSTRRRMERVRRKYTGSLLRDLTGGTGAIEGSAVVWQGPSMIDGSPIVVIITGMKPGSGSDNSKTGTMAQTYIIRSDMSPMEAIWSGLDYAICGICWHRGVETDGPISAHIDRSCYVTVGREIEASIWPSVNGNQYGNRYATITPGQAGSILGEHTTRWASEISLRLGTYGDPAAVPMRVWNSMVRRVDRHTGYTHQWRMFRSRAAAMSKLLMASCETVQDFRDARAMGYRTFSAPIDGRPPEPGEITCPASAEAGYKTTCSSCKLCGGTSTATTKSIHIVLHGGLVGNATRHLDSVVV